MRDRTFGILARCGLRLKRSPERTMVTTSTDWNRLFPGTGGALYGRPGTAGRRHSAARQHGAGYPACIWRGAAPIRVPEFPMAALSGRMAAGLLLREFGSTNLSSTTAMRGGTSMR